MAKTIALWFDYASPYSYLAVARLAGLRDRLLPGAAIEWRPFLLGPIFRQRPNNPSVFQDVSPAERQYRWRDLERLCALYGLPWRRPTKYPPNGLQAARLTLAAIEQGWGQDCIGAVFHAAFAEDRDIADSAVLVQIVDALGRDGQAAAAAMQDEVVKARLKAQVEAAMQIGIFGAPTLVVDGELFWGNDRLEQGLAWGARPWMKGAGKSDE